MKDPIELIGIHPSGAIKNRPDPRDYQFGNEVAQATAPFEWQEGNGPDPALVKLLTLKNQGTSGSCGGQSISYYGQRLRDLYAADAREASAKYPYAQVYVPGGGSAARDLAQIYKSQGIALEADTPSYNGGQPPLEAFMERPQDITSLARLDAAKDQISLAYAFPTFDIETVAQACASCHGVILGIYGTNNGTWLSPQPKAPTAADLAGEPESGACWLHYIYGAQPQIYQGVKGIWFPNSWGATAGIDGWQFLDEAYFASGAIWGAMVLIYNPTPQTPPTHEFGVGLAQGQSGPEITALQQYLAYDGEFNLAPTGYYGAITAQAVLKFQIKYNLASTATLDELGGSSVGPATRAKLNALL